MAMTGSGETENPKSATTGSSYAAAALPPAGGRNDLSHPVRVTSDALDRTTSGEAGYSERADRVARCALVIIATVTVVSWGGATQILAQGDQFPMTLLNPGKRLPAALAIWNTTWTGGGDLHYDAGLVLLSLIAWLPRAAGVSAAVLQRAEFAFLIVGILLSVYALPRELRITSLVMPRLLGSVGYTFSLALIAHVADFLTYSMFFLVTVVPVLYSRAVSADGWRFICRSALTALSTLLFAYVFLNPPQVVVATAQIFVVCFVMTVRRHGKRVPYSKVAVILGITVLTNIWWMVPAYATTFDAALQWVAPTNVLTWSWTQVQSSFLHVWQFTPLWGWPYRQFFPWAAFYNPPIIQVLMLWPLFVVVSAILLNRDQTKSRSASYWLWVIVAIVAAFLVKGLHAPLGGLNLWAYVHVPGFFLFREPETKFLEPLDFAVAILLVIVLNRAWQLGMEGHPAWRVVPWATGLVLVILALPSFTGMVTANASERLAPFRVTIPTYWSDAAAYLNNLPNGDGVAILPNDDFYAMPYTWGMYVADLLPEELFDRPVHYLYDTPQGYVTAAIRLQLIDEQLIAELRAGRTNDLPAALGSQGVHYVILRRDINWQTTIPDRHIISPDFLADKLRQTPGITYLRTFGELDLYVISSSLVRGPLYVVPVTDIHAVAQPDPATIVQSAKGGAVLVSMRAPAPDPPCSVASDNGSAPSPTLTVLSHDLDGYTVRVTTTGAPSLLVLNQSYHPGWVARLDGSDSPNGKECAGSVLSHVVGAGFANAWWVTRVGTSIIHITFADQRMVNVGEIVSAATVSAASLILLVSLVRYDADLPFTGDNAKRLRRRDTQ